MEMYQANQIIKDFPIPLRNIIMKSRDMQLTIITRKFELDPFKLDDLLAEADPEYDNDKCTYKGDNNVSCFSYVFAKYGEDIANKIKSLL